MPSLQTADGLIWYTTVCGEVLVSVALTSAAELSSIVPSGSAMKAPA